MAKLLILQHRVYLFSPPILFGLLVNALAACGLVINTATISKYIQLLLPIYISITTSICNEYYLIQLINTTNTSKYYYYHYK